MNEQRNNFIKLAKHPVKFRMFLFLNLPSALFSGIKITLLSPDKSEVIVPYKWFTKNPFRSTYFACLSMAAEMSTGILIMQHIYKRVPKCSILVQDCKGVFVKKAIGVTTFTCLSGREIELAIEEAYLTNQAKIVKIPSIGYDKYGEVVANFEINWSIKVKTSS